MSQSYRQVLTTPGLPALLLAAALERLAGRMFALTLVLHALLQFGSPAWAGCLSVASLTPGLLFSPIAGALLDRAGPARATAVAQAVAALLMLGLLAVAANPWALTAMVAALSLTSPITHAGMRTILPRLVARDALGRANALDTALFGLTDIAGPAAAGGLMAIAGATTTFAVIAAAYAVATLLLIRVPETRVHQISPPLIRSAVEGLRLVLRSPLLRGLAVSYSLYEVTWGVLSVVVPVLALRSLGAPRAETFIGFAWAASGIAGLCGALLAGRLPIRGRFHMLMATGMALTALAAWPVSVSFGLAGLVAGLMLLGLCAGPIDVGLLTLRQNGTEPAVLGRVLAVSISLNIVGAPVGAALAGWLVEVSAPATMGIAAAASLLAAVMALRLRPAHG